jgi:HK97 family phage prohead protease
VDGLAAMVGVLSRTLYGWFKEIIDPGAFDGADMSDVVCLKNHNQDLILARTLAQTLELSVNEEGHLAYGFEAPDTTTGNDLLEEVRLGNIQHSSFAFEVDEDRWETDTEGNEIRHIVKFRKIHDVSPVVNPAYLQTEVSARNLEIAQESKENFKKSTEETDFTNRDLAEEELKIQRIKYEL